MKNNHQVDIPLLFFFFAFFIVLFGLFSKLTFQKNTSINTNKQARVSSPEIHKKDTVAKIDYNKPVLCDYQTKDSSISAAIDTNSIVATRMSNKDTQRYVVQADCLYSWNIHELSGNKKCGIGSTITIGKQLLSSGLGSIDSLVSTLQKSQKTTTINFQAVLETCKNVKEIKKEVFAVPKNIKFE